jgi:nucleotide-binding universal stress UspA family protein
MFRNVVVGVDAGLGSRDAIALGKLLLAKGGTLALAHVHGGDPRMRTVSPDIAHAERASSRELLETARSEAGIDAELLSTGSLSIGRGLHEIVERHGADLLVVGPHRRSLLGRVLVSDHTADALNGATSAVAVAPGGYAEGPAALGEIGVGYDGSPESKHALRVALELANETGAKVSAFEAVTLAFGHRAKAEEVEKHVEDARAEIAALGDVEPHATFGHPAEELAVYGASVDLLIVGSRGYGPVGRFVRGSTSRQLSHLARCPLLVLTKSAGGTGESETETGQESPAVATT